MRKYKRMKKMSVKKKCLMNKRKQKISLNFLVSYLLILIAPVFAIIAVYFTARNAMLETQKERIENVLLDVCKSFDREITQAQRVGYYVSREERLGNYLNQKSPSKNQGEEFYDLYKLARSYPNYSVTNEFIKDVYIFISGSKYAIKIPQVLPLTQVGIGSLSNFPFYSYETFGEFYAGQDEDQTVFYYANFQNKETLFVPCQTTYQTVQAEKCAIVVELDLDLICQLMGTVLGGAQGAVALLDSDNEILASGMIASKDGAFVPLESGVSFDSCLQGNGFSGKNTVLFTAASLYNGWKITAAIPQSVLTSQIGTARYMIAVLCGVSVFIGILICFAYWYQRKGMVQEFFQLQERMDGRQEPALKDNTWFWRGFPHFLSNVEKLRNTVEKQKDFLLENFLRRLLLGYFDTEAQMAKMAAQAGIFPKAGENYLVVAIEFEDPLLEEPSGSREQLHAVAESLLSRFIPWDFWLYQADGLSYVLVLHSPETLDGEDIKCALTQMNFEFTDEYHMQSYTGISCPVTDLMEISRQYEIASRIHEFARFQRIRVPLLPADLPEEQILEFPLFFTMDMEVKLLNLLRSGSEEQLEELIHQIQSVYFKPGVCQDSQRHTLEIIRGCLYRSLPGGRSDMEGQKLLQKFAKARSAESIFALLREAHRYCSVINQPQNDTSSSLDQARITAYLEERYKDPSLNLAMLAEWLGESERKLYTAFKNVFGMSFSSYLEQQRITHACELLKAGVAVKDTAEQVGYSSDYSFRRAFKRVVGIPPSDFRKIEHGSE